MKTKRRKLRVIAAYSYYNVGDEVDPSGLLREDLIRKKLCEEIPADIPEELDRDDGGEIETATVGPAECAATRVAPAAHGKGRRTRRKRLVAGTE